jgi:hypothetical protein
MATSAHRGQHPVVRAAWKPYVDAGETNCAELICLMPSRWIEPGTPWDLAHDRRTGGYLGPAHARCNRSEAATYRNTLYPGRRWPRRRAKPVTTLPPWSSRVW